MTDSVEVVEITEPTETAELTSTSVSSGLASGQPKAPRKRKQAEALLPLDKSDVDALISKLATTGHSGKQIAHEIALKGMRISESTISRRLRELNLAPAHKPVAQRSGAGSWLDEFRTEIDELALSGKSYSGIWDELTRKHSNNAMLNRILGKDQKAAAIGTWIARERKRVAKKSMTEGRKSVFEPIRKMTPAPVNQGAPSGFPGYPGYPGYPAYPGMPGPAYMTPPPGYVAPSPVPVSVTAPVASAAAAVTPTAPAIPASPPGEFSDWKPTNRKDTAHSDAAQSAPEIAPAPEGRITASTEMARIKKLKADRLAESQAESRRMEEANPELKELRKQILRE